MLKGSALLPYFSIQHSAFSIVVLAVLAATLQQPATPSSSDLFVIQVQVAQRDGTPLAGLKPEQVEVFIDDRPRTVVAVDLRDTHTNATVEGGSAKDRFPGGRVLMLAIDQASFPPSATGAVIEAAQRIVAGVPAHDYLGIVVFP